MIFLFLFISPSISLSNLTCLPRQSDCLPLYFLLSLSLFLPISLLSHTHFLSQLFSIFSVTRYSNLIEFVEGVGGRENLYDI